MNKVVLSAGNESLNEAEYTCSRVGLGRQTEFTEAVGALGKVVPKRPAGLSVSPITRSETNLDCERRGKWSRAC